MEDVALTLFRLADIERKGFIGKRDMQRLQGEVGLSPEQLEAVFESLDTFNYGYLTLDQFLEGINRFKKSDNNLEVRRNESTHSTIIHKTNRIDDNEMVLQKIINLKVFYKSSDLMQDIAKLIRNNEQDELNQTWNQLLSSLYIDVSQLNKQLVEFEEQLKIREQQHQIQVEKLYDELESQVCDERDKHLEEKKIFESILRSQMASKLKEKDQQIIDLIEERNELQQKLIFLHSREDLVKEKNVQLLKGQENQACESDTQKQYIAKLKQTLEELKNQVAVEKDKSYLEGFQHAQRLAVIEEEGLIKQLRLIQEMQVTLLSGMKNEEKPYFKFNNTSC